MVGWSSSLKKKKKGGRKTRRTVQRSVSGNVKRQQLAHIHTYSICHFRDSIHLVCIVFGVEANKKKKTTQRTQTQGEDAKPLQGNSPVFLLAPVLENKTLICGGDAFLDEQIMAHLM